MVSAMILAISNAVPAAYRIAQYLDSLYQSRPLDSTDSTSPRWSGVGVRVSAPVRRGAAPYGDGSRRSQTRSHLISLLP